MAGGGTEIRAVRADETDETLQVLCAAFGLPLDAARPIFYSDPFFDLSHKRLLRTPADGVLSCLTVIPSQIRVGAAWVRLGGIAGVATRPAHRGRGHAGRLLAATVGALASELNYPLSGLFALTGGLYRRLGWETAARACRRTVPLASLPQRPHRARSATESDTEGVRALHRETASGRTGGCLRDDRRWRLIEAAGGRECIVVCAPNGGNVIGYAFWERDGGVLRVLELCAATPDAGSELIGFLAGLRERAVGLEWAAPPGGWDACGLPAAPGECAPEPELMLRLTDLPGALAAIHGPNLAPVLAQSERHLTIRAADPLRPENDRPLRLTPLGVAPGRSSDADWIAADIRALAPIYLGLHTPSEVHEVGDLSASSPEALALADTLFPRRAPFVCPLDQF